MIIYNNRETHILFDTQKVKYLKNGKRYSFFFLWTLGPLVNWQHKDPLPYHLWPQI